MIIELFAALVRLALWVIAISFIVWIFRNATRGRVPKSQQEPNPDDAAKPKANVTYRDVKDAKFTELDDDTSKRDS
ncbi:MAG TPA: hypothetical protein VMM57_08525 [Bacteroidota bacterium]|nr:hypothetical protein [Bacteroidota bacterium]